MISKNFQTKEVLGSIKSQAHKAPELIKYQPQKVSGPRKYHPQKVPVPESSWANKVSELNNISNLK